MDAETINNAIMSALTRQMLNNMGKPDIPVTPDLVAKMRTQYTFKTQGEDFVLVPLTEVANA